MSSDSDSILTASDDGEEGYDSGDLSHLGAAATVKVQTTQHQSFQHVTKGSERLFQEVLRTLHTSDHDLARMPLQQEVVKARFQDGNETIALPQNIIQVQKLFGDVTVQGTRNLNVGGTQNIGTPRTEKQLTQTAKIRNRTTSRIGSWVKGMVRTASLDKVMEKLNKGTKWITVRGCPGEGKTTAAYMALTELHRTGRQVFQVTSPSEFSVVSLTCPQAVILLDDIFGNLEFDQAGWVRWKPVLNEILDEKEHRSHEQEEETKKNCVTVILVGRDYVLNSAFGYMGRLSDFFTQEEYVVDMSHTVDREIKEKIAIWETISQSSRVKLNQDEIDKICRIRCPHGFPHVCRLFVTMYKENSKINFELFFANPLEFLNQTIARFMKSQKLLMLFREMIKCDGQIRIRDLSKLKSGSKLTQIGLDLVGTYLRKEDDYFLFDHPSVYDSVAFNLCKLHPLFVIETCNLSFIHERLRLEHSRDIAPSRESGLVVYLPRSFTGDLSRRFAMEISNGHLLQVLSHEAFSDEHFIKQTMSQLKMTHKNFIKLTDSKTKESCLSLLASNKSPQLLMYIDNHTDIHLSQSDMNTVLYGVCKYAASDVIKYLHETRDTLDINFQYGTMEQSPLMIGAQTRDSQFALDILSLNPDINAYDTHGKTAFHYLCENGHLSVVKQMIGMGIDVNNKDWAQLSPLFYACRSNNTQVVKLLLDSGANVDRSEVVVACERGNMETVRLLFEEDAKVNMKTLCGTLLHSACCGGHLNVIRYLIKKGARVNKAGCSGQSPLHRACEYSNHQAVQCLLEHGAVIDCRDSKGNTPLHTAARNGYKECVDVLVKAGADMNVQNEYCNTALHTAAGNGYKECVDVFLKAGSDVNVQNNYGKTPLHTATGSGSKECVDVLVKAGADVNLLCKDGKTPLHMAVHYNSEVGVYLPDMSVCQTLITHKSDMNIQDIEGNTPLHALCCVNSDTEIVKAWTRQPASSYEDVYSTLVALLIDHGADVNMQNNRGESALRGWCQTLVSRKLIKSKKRKNTKLSHLNLLYCCLCDNN